MSVSDPPKAACAKNRAAWVRDKATGVAATAVEFALEPLAFDADTT